MSSLLQEKNPRHWYPKCCGDLHDSVVDVDITDKLGNKHVHPETDERHDEPTIRYQRRKQLETQNSLRLLQGQLRFVPRGWGNDVCLCGSGIMLYYKSMRVEQ